MFYLTTHSTHFIYGYMASDIWWRTILIVRKETRCRHIGYSYRLTARILLHAPSHRQVFFVLFFCLKTLLYLMDCFNTVCVQSCVCVISILCTMLSCTCFVLILCTKLGLFYIDLVYNVKLCLFYIDLVYYVKLRLFCTDHLVYKVVSVLYRSCVQC